MDFGKGCLPDPKDTRDFPYEPVMAAPQLEPVDWDKGFDAFKELGITGILQNQDGSSSCVGQGWKQYTRRVVYFLKKTNNELSARDIYSHIFLGGGGAYIRDGGLFVSSRGILNEIKAPSYDNGNPPSESFMRKETRHNGEDEAEGKLLDLYSVRMIEGSTADIDIFAHAIQNFYGCAAGFTGTNPGWSQGAVRAPRKGETKWGHCVDLCAYGKTDVVIPGKNGHPDLPIGTKAVFTMNSWGGQNTITEGRWKGYQAIPEAYFQATMPTIEGDTPGGYVFNSWVLVPDAALPPNQQAMDFITKNQDKIVQITTPDLPESGRFMGIVVGDKMRTIGADGVGLEHPTEGEKLILTALVRNKLGTGIEKDLYDQLPKQPL